MFFLLLSQIVWDQFSSVAQSCLTLCNPMDCNTPGLPVHGQFPEFTQTHVHWVGDAIQPFHPLSSPSLPAFNLSHHHGLFQGVSSSHQVARVLELQLQLQHQSFQWIFRVEGTEYPGTKIWTLVHWPPMGMVSWGHHNYTIALFWFQVYQATIW